MIFRLSLLVVASVSALAVSQIKIDSSKKRKSPDINHSEKNGSSFKEIERKEEEKFTDNSSDEKTQQEEEGRTKKMKTQDLKPGICNLVKKLEKRKLVLDRKLLELSGLKEQHLYVAQLYNHLEDKVTEIGMLSGTVDKLQDETKNLQEEMKQAILAKTELEMAKKKLDELRKRMNVNGSGSHMKQELLMLEQQVSEFQCNNGTFNNDAISEKKLKATRQVELEFMEMQRRNRELELEKRELTVKLVGAQARITSLSSMTQDKIMGKTEEERRILRHRNEILSKEVERLQRNRLNMVEELVYQRWLNACLRFETQNYQTPSTKTSCDLRNNRSRESEKKAKQLVLDLSFDRISSPTSSNESNEIDSCSTESSSNSQRSIYTKKSGFLHSIKRWGRSKDDLSTASSPDKSCRRSLFTGNGLIRRHSTSLVPSNSPSLLSSEGDTTAIITPYGKKILHESTASPDTPNFPRVRRVSFCNSVEKFIPDVPKCVEELKDDKEIYTQRCVQGSCMDASPKFVAKLAGSLSDSSLESIKRYILETQLDRRIEAEKLHSKIHIDLPGENQVETSMVHLVAAFLFFLFTLLLYFLLLTAGIY